MTLREDPSNFYNISRNFADQSTSMMVSPKNRGTLHSMDEFFDPRKIFKNKPNPGLGQLAKNNFTAQNPEMFFKKSTTDPFSN
jgi:hypothetical protein